MFARCALSFLVALAGVAWASGTASAAFKVYTFNLVSTDTSLADEATAEAQARVEVTDVGVSAGQIKFTFTNLGPNAMSITDVYFDDGTLLDIATVVNHPDVFFQEGANPNNLNAPAAVNFNATAGFLASADNPAQDGVRLPGEFVSIIFDLKLDSSNNVQDYDDVINALTLGLNNPNVDMPGGLRIGIKAQAFALGGSAKLVNGGPLPQGPTNPVPAPPAVVLAGLGAICIGGFARLRRRFAAAA